MFAVIKISCFLGVIEMIIVCSYQFLLLWIVFWVLWKCGENFVRAATEQRGQFQMKWLECGHRSIPSVDETNTNTKTKTKQKIQILIQMQRGQFQMKKLEDGHCSIPRDSGPELINTNTNTNKDTNTNTNTNTARQFQMMWLECGQ